MARVTSRTSRTNRRPRRQTAKPRAATAAKHRQPLRMLNGIPLKRATIWVYDTDSPEFKAARRRDMKMRRTKDWDGDGMQWVDAVFNDPDWQKWWR